MKKSRVYSEQKIRALKNTSFGTIEYIWPTSIPYSWNKIMNKYNISRVKIKKSNRNTLGFLEETQKYINKICKPEVSEHKVLIKSKKKSLVLPLINKPNSLTPDRGVNSKLESFQSQFVKNKLAVLKNLKKSRNQQNESFGTAHKQNHSCGSLYISFKKYS